MKGNTVNILDSLLEEVNELKKKEELLGLILRYYDVDTKTFNVPEKWKNSKRLSQEKLKQLGETPRVWLFNQIVTLLPQKESVALVDDFIPEI